MEYQTIQPGDHICYFCGPHYHHGIYCGEVFYKNRNYENVVIHFEAKHQGGQIRGIDYDKFAQNREIYVTQYERGNCFSSQLVVARAISKLGQSGYALLWNNCEHFAQWCKTGKKSSDQVSLVGKVGGSLLGSIATGVFLPLAIPEVIGVGAVVATGLAVGHLGGLVTDFFADLADY